VADEPLTLMDEDEILRKVIGDSPAFSLVPEGAAIAQARTAIIQFADGQINNVTARMTVSEALKKIGYWPGIPHRETRLDLNTQELNDELVETGANLLRGLRNWRESQNPDVLDAFPAWELVKFETRRERINWKERWKAAGGRSGKMIALKSDSIWRRISDFGYPFPPFAKGSGMWVQDVDHGEAKRLGIA
jgi:hypothetical protein